MRAVGITVKAFGESIRSLRDAVGLTSHTITLDEERREIYFILCPWGMFRIEENRRTSILDRSVKYRGINISVHGLVDADLFFVISYQKYHRRTFDAHYATFSAPHIFRICGRVYFKFSPNEICQHEKSKMIQTASKKLYRSCHHSIFPEMLNLVFEWCQLIFLKASQMTYNFTIWNQFQPLHQRYQISIIFFP